MVFGFEASREKEPDVGCATLGSRMPRTLRTVWRPEQAGPTGPTSQFGYVNSGMYWSGHPLLGLGKNYNRASPPESSLETSAYRASGAFAPYCVADVCRCAAQQLPPSSEEASIRQPRDEELTGHLGRKFEAATRRGQGDERETGDTGKVVRRDPIVSQSKAPPPLNPT